MLVPVRPSSARPSIESPVRVDDLVVVPTGRKKVEGREGVLSGQAIARGHGRLEEEELDPGIPREPLRRVSKGVLRFPGTPRLQQGDAKVEVGSRRFGGDGDGSVALGEGALEV